MVCQIVSGDAAFECFYYLDSVKALKEFRPNYYDLILLDIKMPLLSRFEFYKRRVEVDKIIEIIFIIDGEEYYEELRKQSYPELTDNNIKYIQKPLGNEQPIKMVNEIIK